MKFNTHPLLRAIALLIIAIIGVFSLTSCLMNSSSTYAETNKEIPGTSVSDTVTEESATVSETTAYSSSSSQPETVTKTSSSKSEDTETLTLAEKKSSTAKITTSKKPSSTSSSATSSFESSGTKAPSTRVNITDRMSSVFSRISLEKGTTTVEPVEVTVHPDSSSTKAPAMDFSDSAFLGNSRVLSIENYGFAKNVYGKVGLNVDTVFTAKCEGSSVPVIDELKGKSFKNVFIMFGDNECGWDNMNVFVKHYKKVIDAVRERVPGAEIYLISVLPISESTSAKNEYGYNQNAINNVNKLIKKLAEDEGITYVNAASAITNSKGYLPDEASTDGCHLGKEYTRRWLAYTAKYL